MQLRLPGHLSRLLRAIPPVRLEREIREPRFPGSEPRSPPEISLGPQK